MTDAILIFTFSPIQPFIAQARRAADLYVGSQILAQMAQAAAQTIGPQYLIYPAPLNGTLSNDTPNVIVARVPYNQAEVLANQAHEALESRWLSFVHSARKELLEQRGAPADDTWQAIWGRQTQPDHVWQVFWVAVPMEPGGYGQAYETARRALDAVKHSRAFPQVEEPGDKDSLSGAREALHLSGQKARDYWADVSRKATAAKIRPNGRERLDAIGATKRFCELANQPFPSTSTIASADFRQRAKAAQAGTGLALYRSAVEEAIGSFLYAARPYDIVWPYDGDLLFLETLTPKRLEDSYHGIEHPEFLDEARRALRELYKAVGAQPSPYYAVIVFDGDSMGEHISALLRKPDPEAAHRDFSRCLSRFAQQVPAILGQTFRREMPDLPGTVWDSDEVIGREFLIYNGGDDVLALAPLSMALPMAQALAQGFAATVPDSHASAGIAIAHHLYPLDAALQAARAAEKAAKAVPGKAAVAVQVLKRSGETVTMRSKWESLGGLFNELMEHFARDRLSSRFAYDLSSRAHIVTALPAAARQATLKHLVERHKTNLLTDPGALVESLATWTQALDDQKPPEKIDGVDIPQGLAELARWAEFARFVAQGGSE